jgi:hypothetical protein
MAETRKPARAESWMGCKRVLKNWPAAGLLGLVHELYKLSDDNRRFLHARLLDHGEVHGLAAAEKVIRRMVAPSEIFKGRFKHSALKRVVDQFERAVDDPAPVAELLLIDLDASLEAFKEVGNDEAVVDHLYASMVRLNEMLALVDDAVQLSTLVEQLGRLGQRWANEFGYGVSDELAGLAWTWRDRLHGKQPQ